MKRICTILMLVLFASAFATHEIYAYKFTFETVGDVVKKIKSRYNEIDTYEATFKISTERAGKRTYQSGVIKSKAPNKLSVDFDKPYGQRIVSNGKTMWIFIPGMNVVAEQDLQSESGSIFAPGSKSGLRRLFSKFHYKFASKDQPETGADGKKYYTLFLKQKESRGGYRTMKIWCNENYMIVRASGETAAGKKVEIEFSNIKTNGDIPNGAFKFDIPSNARIIKNPMVSEE